MTVHAVTSCCDMGYADIETRQKASLFCTYEWSWFMMKDELSLITFAILMKVFLNLIHLNFVTPSATSADLVWFLCISSKCWTTDTHDVEIQELKDALLKSLSSR